MTLGNKSDSKLDNYWTWTKALLETAATYKKYRHVLYQEKECLIFASNKPGHSIYAVTDLCGIIQSQQAH